jgi:hypothetical protein
MSLLVPALVAASAWGAAAHGALRAPGSELHAGAEDNESMVKPFHFNQRLLVCNAYPNSSPMECKKNGQDMLVKEGSPVAFRECRYIDGQVQSHDRLDISLRDLDFHGTFEVGALPTSDAVLLLVPYKRPGSPMIRFQSFAFPTRADGKDAQLALIDTFAGNATATARLLMEDHIANNENKTVSKRVEQLNFDRVYSVEAGLYDAAVGKEVTSTRGALKMLNLQQDQNYVVLRTGDDEANFPESLVVFPDTPLPSPPKRSGAPGREVGSLAVVFAFVLTALAY